MITTNTTIQLSDIHEDSCAEILTFLCLIEAITLKQAIEFGMGEGLSDIDIDVCVSLDEEELSVIAGCIDLTEHLTESAIECLTYRVAYSQED